MRSCAVRWKEAAVCSVSVRVFLSWQQPAGFRPAVVVLKIFFLFFFILFCFSLCCFLSFSLCCVGVRERRFSAGRGRPAFAVLVFYCVCTVSDWFLLSFFLFVLLFFLCFYLECWDKFKKELWGEGEGELLKWWYENVRQGSGEQDQKAKKQRVRCGAAWNGRQEIFGKGRQTWEKRGRKVRKQRVQCEDRRKTAGIISLSVSANVLKS